MKSFSQFIREQDLQESGPNEPKFYNPNTEKKFQGSVEGRQLKKTRRRSTPSITRGSGIGPTERINPDDTKTQQTQNKIANQRVNQAKKSGNISDFSNKPIEGAPNTKTLVRGTKGETIANPVNPTSKKTAETTARASTAGTGGKEVKNQTKFSTDTSLENPKTNKVNKVSKKISGDGKIDTKITSSKLDSQKWQGPEPPTKIQPGTNTTITPSKSGNVLKTRANRITTNVTNTKNPITVNDYKNVSSSSSGSKVKTTKPQVTTNVSSPKRFKSFLDRVLVSTGVKPDPKYKSKFITPSSNVTVSGSKSGTNKVLSDVSKKALRSNIFKGLGRFAGGAFAAKDAYDKARDEKLLGRSRTSQILGGLSRGLGGYLGGALGATLGTLGGGGIGSFALGTGGAITGYNLGSRAGEYLYNKGRELATGETKLKLPGKKTFKKFKDDVTNKVKGLDLRNLGRTDKDKK